MAISGFGRVSIQFIAIAWFIVVVGTSLSAEEHEGLQKEDVPAAVLSRFKMDSAGADIDEIYLNEEGEHPLYEFWIDDWNKAFVYQDDGAQYAVKEDIKPQSLPEDVRDVVRKAYPSERIDYAYTVLKGSDTEYEVVLETGRENELKTSEGTPIAISWSYEEEDEDNEEEESGDEGEEEETNAGGG